MKRGASRVVALWMLFGLILQLSGGTTVWAANGSVKGRVAVEAGTLPQGAQVRATPLDGGAPRMVPVAPDGTYQFTQLPEGAYTFQVVGPDGALLGSGTTTLVAPGALQLNLKAIVQPTSVTEKQPEKQKEEIIPPPPPPPSTPGAHKKWIVLGAVVGSLGVGLAVSNSNDSSGSASTP